MSESLTKVQFDLPHHWAADSEALWAKGLGDDLYEIRNIPFHAYGVNYLDVVRATSAPEGAYPAATEVVRTSGHVTIRVIFMDHVAESDQVAMLDGLKPLCVGWERGTSHECALDLEPSASVLSVRNRLDTWEKGGKLSYETCEARDPNSFDDLPAES